MNNFYNALSRLRAFNKMVTSHEELSQRLIYGDHNYLQWRQAWLFKSFQAYRNTDNEPIQKNNNWIQKTFYGLKWWISGIGANLLTFWVFMRGQREVLVFSIDKISTDKDHDFRLDGIYKFIKKHNYRYAEIFHAEMGSRLFKNAWHRRRSGIYREAFVFLANVKGLMHIEKKEDKLLVSGFECQGFDLNEQVFVRKLVQELLESITSSRSQIYWYRRTLRYLKPRLILSIDDTRYYQELCVAARAENIPLYAFQHGSFTKYHVSWLSAVKGVNDDGMPTIFFTWSSYWKNELLRLGTNIPEEKIFVSGNPKKDGAHFDAVQYNPPNESKVIELLVPFESDAPTKEIQAIMRNLLKNDGIKIWFKTRPDIELEMQLQKYGFSKMGKDKIEIVSNYHAILDHVHAVVGTYSTFLYELIPYKKPVFILQTSVDIGEAMVINGLADHFDALHVDAGNRLRILCQEASKKLDRRVEIFTEDGVGFEDTLKNLFRKDV